MVLAARKLCDFGLAAVAPKGELLPGAVIRGCVFGFRVWGSRKGIHKGSFKGVYKGSIKEFRGGW